jgi:hypothetical protein
MTLGLVIDTSLTGLRVARELDRIAEIRGYPAMLVSDKFIAAGKDSALDVGLPADKP